MCRAGAFVSPGLFRFVRLNGKITTTIPPLTDLLQIGRARLGLVVDDYFRLYAENCTNTYTSFNSNARVWRRPGRTSLTRRSKLLLFRIKRNLSFTSRTTIVAFLWRSVCTKPRSIAFSRALEETGPREVTFSPEPFNDYVMEKKHVWFTTEVFPRIEPPHSHLPGFSTDLCHQNCPCSCRPLVLRIATFRSWRIRSSTTLRISLFIFLKNDLFQNESPQKNAVLGRHVPVSATSLVRLKTFCVFSFFRGLRSRSIVSSGGNRAEERRRVCTYPVPSVRLHTVDNTTTTPLFARRVITPAVSHPVVEPTIVSSVRIARFAHTCTHIIVVCASRSISIGRFTNRHRRIPYVCACVNVCICICLSLFLFLFTRKCLFSEGYSYCVVRQVFYCIACRSGAFSITIRNSWSFVTPAFASAEPTGNAEVCLRNGRTVLEVDRVQKTMIGWKWAETFLKVCNTISFRPNNVKPNDVGRRVDEPSNGFSAVPVVNMYVFVQIK